jgi:site-specific DNA-methyltransferase (adenine-specific)
LTVILADLPYGRTRCKWDKALPLDKLWTEYKRIIKPGRAIVLTASQPFTSLLVYSNIKMFRYAWVWLKEQGTNFLDAKKLPLKIHEDILVFSQGRAAYYPQMTTGKPFLRGIHGSSGEVNSNIQKIAVPNKGTRYPTTVLEFKRERGLHPTQKPVALFEYLIRTYTQPGELVLDNTAGVFTTVVAALKTGRLSIGIEKDTEKGYFQTGLTRIDETVKQLVQEGGKNARPLSG